MVKKVIWTEDAINDKIDIFSYWNNRNKSSVYSRKLDRMFKNTITAVLKNPNLGKKTDLEDVKKIIVKDYLMIYEYGIFVINILRIWDTRQGPKKLLFNK